MGVVKKALNSGDGNYHPDDQYDPDKHLRFLTTDKNPPLPLDQAIATVHRKLKINGMLDHEFLILHPFPDQPELAVPEPLPISKDQFVGAKGSPLVSEDELHRETPGGGKSQKDKEKCLEVREWLTNVVGNSMQAYYANFIDNGYESLDIIKAIESVNELEEIGIIVDGHREIIFSAIEKLKGVKGGEYPHRLSVIAKEFDPEIPIKKIKGDEQIGEDEFVIGGDEPTPPLTPGGGDSSVEDEVVPPPPSYDELVAKCINNFQKKYTGNGEKILNEFVNNQDAITPDLNSFETELKEIPDYKNIPRAVKCISNISVVRSNVEALNQCLTYGSEIYAGGSNGDPELYMNELRKLIKSYMQIYVLGPVNKPDTWASEAETPKTIPDTELNSITEKIDTGFRKHT